MRKLFLTLSLSMSAWAQVPAHTQHYPHISNGTILNGAPIANATVCTWMASRFDFIWGWSGIAPALSACNFHLNGNATKTYTSAYVDEMFLYPSQMYGMQAAATNRGFVLENMLLHSSVDMYYSTSPPHGVGGNFNVGNFDGFEVYNGGGIYQSGVFTYNGSTWSDVTYCAQKGAISGCEPLGSSKYWGNPTIGGVLYVGYMMPFDQINFGTLQQARVGGSVAYAYCNAATSNICTNWNILTPQSDGTSGLTQAGELYFYPPSDWVPTSLVTGTSLNSQNVKYWIRTTVTGASTSPIFGTLYGDDWTVTSSTCGANTCNFRGWNATDPARINVGTVLEYNPNAGSGVSANASARFRYQARVTANNGLKGIYGNPSDVESGTHTWARYMADAGEAILPGNSSMDALSLDDATEAAPLPTTPANAYSYYDANQATNGWQTDEVATLEAIASYWHAEVGANAWVGANNTPNSPINGAGWQGQGGTPFLDYNLQEGWYDSPTTWAPNPGFKMGGTIAPDWALPANNPNGTRFYYQITDTDSLSTPWAAGQGIGMSNWHYADRGNRTPLMSLAMYYLGSNQNTGFMYRGGGESVNSQYLQTDQVYIYQTPTTLTASVTTGTTSITVASVAGCSGSTILRLGTTASGDDVSGTWSGSTFTTASHIYNSYASGASAVCVQQQHLSAIASPLTSAVWAWTRWFPAMAVDIGAPNAAGYRGGARAVTETGNTPWLYGSALSGQPAGTCTGTLCPDVWRRDFTNAIVLFRPWKSGMIESELDTPSQPIALGGTYYPLNADGTVGPAVASITLRGGEGAILMMSGSSPVLSCNAGAQQTFRAGFPAQLDGSGSQAGDGGALSYLWQRLSGPSAVRWSSRTVAKPVINGLVAGSYVFQLTVTEGVNRAATCTVKQGVAASGDNGVVITNNPAVDTLLGPLMLLGNNPWPWYDDRHAASANLQMNAMDEYYPAWWDVSGRGTVTVTAGSNAITGAGTTFTTTFCQGPGNPHTPKGNAVIAVWYQTGVPGQTGRRMSAITGCADDGDLTVDDAWDVGAIPAGSGLNYASDEDSTHYATNWGWGQAALPGNYGDNVAGYYALYYRSGIDDYLNAAQKLADRFWLSPMVDRGASQVPGHSGSYGYPGRSLSALGLVLRALELEGTQSDMWAGLHKIWDASMGYLNSAATNPNPSAADTLDKAYDLAMVSYCALFDSDPAYQSSCQAAISSSFGGIWTPGEGADGSWPQLYYTTSSWDTNTSASLVNGSTTVVGNGTVWNASAFPCTIWLTNAPGSMPPNNQGGDTASYAVTFVDATHLQLDRPYAGITGTHGWALANGMIGWGAQPVVMGTLAAAFDLAAKAIAVTDPANSALASSYNLAAANWIQTYGYWPLQKGLYNAAQGINCQTPINDGNTACTGGNSLESARALDAGALRGIMAAYASSQSTALLDFGDTLYNAMFAKPGTCPSGSQECVPDGSYISGMDDGGSMMTGSSPEGNQSFGTFFGFNKLSAWPAYAVGGPVPANSRAYYVSFNSGAVRGAATVRVIATEPSGQALQSDCTASPCRVVVDARQGDPLIEVWYLSNTGAVLAKTAIPL